MEMLAGGAAWEGNGFWSDASSSGDVVSKIGFVIFCGGIWLR